jgi:hypothetical protein
MMVFPKNNGSLIIHENGFLPFLTILSSFAGSFCLISHILIDRIDPQVLTVIKLLERVINYAKLAYYMQKRAKNEVFSHVIKFGGFNCSDIPDNDSTKCFSLIDRADLTDLMPC